MYSPPQIKVLIVDDEPEAREEIRELLNDFPEASVIGEISNGRESVSEIQKLKPDLIFLDVPDIDKLSVLKTEISEDLPLVILVSENDNLGLEAFEADVVDYLLKPFDKERFGKAVQQAMKRLTAERNNQQLQLSALIESFSGASKFLKQITIRAGNRIFLVKVEEIDWIEAERNYVRIHSNGQSYLRRESISSIETQLDPARFRRIHRSTIVNMDSVRELQSAKGSEYKVVLHTGAELMLSRSFHDNMREFLA